MSGDKCRQICIFDKIAGYTAHIFGFSMRAKILFGKLFGAERHHFKR